MAYLKESNKNSVQRGCFWIFLFIFIASVGSDVALPLLSAVQTPSEGGTINLGFGQIDQNTFSEFIKGGIGILIFGFIANLLINSIDGRHKLIAIYWPFRSVTEDLETFIKKKGYSSHSRISEMYPDAFSADIEPNERARAWYDQIYIPVRDKESVIGANKEYLYWREIYTFSLTILVLYSITFFISWLLGLEVLNWPGLTTALVCSIFLKIAAQNASNTLVKNSLAEALNG